MYSDPYPEKEMFSTFSTLSTSMTREEILANLERHRELLKTEAPKLAIIHQGLQLNIKEKLYSSVSEVAIILREHTGEVGMAQELENIMSRLETMSNDDWSRYCKYWTGQGLSFIGNLAVKAKTRGLHPKGETVALPVEDPTAPIREELASTKRDLERVLGENSELRARSPSFPSRDEISMGWVFKHFPWWLVVLILTGLAGDLKIGYEIYQSLVGGPPERANQQTIIPAQEPK